MIRGLLLATTGIGLLALACNATPDIPNDLKSNNPTYPQKGKNTGNDSEANNEGEQVLTGGRAPSRPPAEQSDSGTSPAPATDAGTTPIDSGTTPTPTNNQCAGAATQTACFQCCDQQNPGTAAKWNQFWDDCACATNKCGNVCAQSWCAGFFPNQGDACDNCLNQVSNACSTQADAVCKQDAACAPLVLCDEGSGCLAKP